VFSKVLSTWPAKVQAAGGPSGRLQFVDLGLPTPEGYHLFNTLANSVTRPSRRRQKQLSIVSYSKRSVYTNICLYIYTHMNLYMCLYVSIRVCIYIYVYIYTYEIWNYTYIYISFVLLVDPIFGPQRDPPISTWVKHLQPTQAPRSEASVFFGDFARFFCQKIICNMWL